MFLRKKTVSLLLILAIIFTCLAPAYAETVMPDLNGLYMPSLLVSDSPPADEKEELKAYDPDPNAIVGLPDALSIPASSLSKNTLGMFSLQPSLSQSSVELGDAKSFTDYRRGGTLEVVAAAIGEHCIVYVDSDGERTPKNTEFLPTGSDVNPNAQKIADEFDDVIFGLITGTFGMPLDVYGNTFTADSKINIILYNANPGYSGGGNYVAGFFHGNDYIGKVDENIFIDIHASGGYSKFTSANEEYRVSFYGTIAHEFQHLINYSYFVKNYSQRLLVEPETVDPDTEYDPDTGEPYALNVTTWYNEGLSGLADILYQRVKGYQMSSSHRSNFVNNTFAKGIGYVPTAAQWSAASGNNLLANYGAAALLVYEYYSKAKKSHTDNTHIRFLTANPGTGYIYSKRNIGQGYFDLTNPNDTSFNDFFTAAMLNLEVNSPYFEDVNIPCYSVDSNHPIGNVWGLRGTGSYTQVSALSQTTTFNSDGRAYYTKTFLASKPSANGIVQISLPADTGAEYYIITPYEGTQINTRAKWNTARKMAGKLSASNTNVIDVGTDNLFAVLAIAQDSAVNESIICQPSQYELRHDSPAESFAGNEWRVTTKLKGTTDSPIQIVQMAYGSDGLTNIRIHTLNAVDAQQTFALPYDEDAAAFKLFVLAKDGGLTPLAASFSSSVN